MATVTDILTLDNFASKMPSWAPELPNHLYALVDMGRVMVLDSDPGACSNGIRFSISDLSPPEARLLKCLYRERAAISLFDALNASSSSGPRLFPPEVITQVSQTLARFKSIADEFGVPSDHISVFATEAMRTADNAASMLDAILAASGLGVHVLAPEVETLFGAVGARSGFADVNGLFLDLGGGSVQMTYVNSSTRDYATRAAQTGKSLPFGAAKLMAILGSGDKKAQVSAVDDLQAGMRDAFSKLQQEFPPLKATQSSPSDGIDIYLCGGGFRGYGSMLMHCDPIQPYPISAVGAYTVDGSFFKKTRDMRRMNTEYDGEIFGMSNRRRQQFPAIATVVEALIDAVPRIRTVTFCSGGNREGALMMKLPDEVREASPLPLLHTGDKLSSEIMLALMDTLQSALPTSVDFSNISTVFTLGLGQLFASEIWTRAGEPSEANAAYELHQAITRNPTLPGFTHLARSVLGLTLCFRWGANLAPVDRQLYTNLRRLVNKMNPEAIFWAEYIGAVASLLAEVCPTVPETSQRLASAVHFSARMKNGKNKVKLQLTVSLSPALCQALDPQDIAGSFKKVWKYQDDAGTSPPKVEIIVQKMQS
ncbi:Uu.00g015330.m01.CDS01 [Anthostomella pinea]|uniref:Uu.00g015330.m01.CDS01 n=1 Tax=Anthostomella pinea TaxID=933095 RepID=A0AAI8YQB3_9PEZI|nr:Uu.00g015330.m01.CDS01 [Anthostomella pinea]